MSDLTEFLLARIAEDEAVARRALALYGEREFTVEWGWSVHIRHASGGHGTSFVDGAPDPARVLAECEAKRRIVALADDATGLDMQVDGEFLVGSRDEAADPYIGDLILRALALPYADHPDYDVAWRPRADGACVKDGAP
ncbi:MAG: DUF6221 family protein [Cellulomonas sp.]|uniref:DUF6221 family protein n=1 Tax=Cellulomonas sp. TaxID=40001 RepID=UPI00258F1023|nr:DUF6221 family protein [Cellulomonas sp.]MCR6706564.1 DUF6221 family protein [Cellulomonas sp.]